MSDELGVFLDCGSLDRGDLDLNALKATLPRWHLHSVSHPDSISARIAGATIVISNKARLEELMLRAAPGLRLICVAATGTNNVDLDAARALGIAVCNVRGYATASVVQHVLTLILTLSTNLLEFHQSIREGGWQKCPHFCMLDYPIRELAGKTIGIVGYGALGRGVAQAARDGLGMQVLVAQRKGTPSESNRVPLDKLLPQVDVLSLHCPLTPETRGLIGAAELALMKPDALIVNTARGGIVDEIALIDALKAGRLGGAGIDVLTTEPPVHGHLLLDGTIPNLIVTPHIAWTARESRQRLVDEMVENIRAFFAGTPRNRVD